MPWTCIPINCVKRISKLKHFAPLLLTGLLAGNPLPATCGVSCHWIWTGPIPSDMPLASPEGIYIPDAIMRSGDLLLPGPTYKDTEKTVSAVPEPASALIMLPALLGFFFLFKLYRKDKKDAALSRIDSKRAYRGLH